MRNTSPPPAITAGSAALARALAAQAAPCSRSATITATWPACERLAVPGGAGRRAARRCRRRSRRRCARGRRRAPDQVARLTSWQPGRAAAAGSGTARGAARPASRLPAWCAVDVAHHDLGSPSAAPRSTTCSRSTSASSLAPVGAERRARGRRLRAADEVGRRRRRRGRRRSPAWGRRSAPSWRGRRTPGRAPPTARGRCPGTRRPARSATAPASARGPGRRRRPSAVREPAQQVVVGQDAEPPLAPLDLGAYRARERHPGDGHRAPRVGLGAAPPAGRRPPCGRARARRRGRTAALCCSPPNRREVEVVDDLDDELVERLDQGRAGVGVAGDAERAQHELAELVGGRDGGRVEGGQRVAQPPARRTARSASSTSSRCGEQRVVGVGRAGSASARSASTSCGAHPLAQLLAGRPAEGDDEHLVERRHALGDVARHQRADGERLAGAGAGLEQGGPGRQRPGEVEGLRIVVTASPAPLLRPVSSGLHSRSASAPNRDDSPGCSSPATAATPRARAPARPAPHARTCSTSEHSPGNRPSSQS